MRDLDSKIRGPACESLYNIIKAIRETSLILFTEIFDCLTRVMTDVDEEVRRAAGCLDRILKDVVMEAASSTKNFKLDKFISQLCTTIRAQNPMIRKFIIGWISILQNIPNINMLGYLPLYLEQLFLMLGDSNK